MEDKSVEPWKDLENTGENSEKIGKIWKKIVKWFGKYGKKASRIVKCLENREENCEKIWKIWKKSRLNSEMIWKIWR